MTTAPNSSPELAAVLREIAEIEEDDDGDI